MYLRVLQLLANFAVIWFDTGIEMDLLQRNCNAITQEFVHVYDDLKLQDVNQKVKIFILTHESENLSKESKKSAQPTGHGLRKVKYLNFDILEY